MTSDSRTQLAHGLSQRNEREHQVWLSLLTDPAFTTERAASNVSVHA